MCDILLPGLNGFQVCQRIREKGIWTPILMLTAKDGEWDQAEALEAGADDYLTKPFSFVVLRAHIRALARPRFTADDRRLQRARAQATSRSTCVSGGASVASRRSNSTRREFELLDTLIAHPGEAIPKEELMRTVWGPEFNGDPNIVEVYIGYLRRKIDTPFGRRSVETVRGFGYRLAADGAPR